LPLDSISPNDPLGEPHTTIAFGSCANQDSKQVVWDTVLAKQPDVFDFAGEKIFEDTVDMAVLQAK
jgi:alkaline phosphatase D